jgi:hypothetical protein
MNRIVRRLAPPAAVGTVRVLALVASASAWLPEFSPGSFVGLHVVTPGVSLPFVDRSVGVSERRRHRRRPGDTYRDRGAE